MFSFGYLLTYGGNLWILTTSVTIARKTNIQIYDHPCGSDRSGNRSGMRVLRSPDIVCFRRRLSLLRGCRFGERVYSGAKEEWPVAADSATPVCARACAVGTGGPPKDSVRNSVRVRKNQSEEQCESEGRIRVRRRSRVRMIGQPLSLSHSPLISR